MAIMLENVKSPYLKQHSSNFDAIWYTNAGLELDDSQMTKYENFLNSRWQMAQFYNRFLATIQQPLV